MADKIENTTNATTASFNKGMVKDIDFAFNPEGSWTHARNAVNNSVHGQVGIIANEAANKYCQKTPYTLIGALPLKEDKWVLFSTDNYNCEIGLFDESECSYIKKANSPCLGFKTTHLITGATRENFDCTWSVYFSDGLNPDRVLNLDNVPYVEVARKNVKANECYVPTYTDQLDCEALRLAPLLTTPCYTLNKSKSSGTLPNGAYQVAIAYSINGVRVTDYFTPSNVQTVFSHSNVAGAIEVDITSTDLNFEEFELAMISTVGMNTTARSIGFYSTATKTIVIDKLNDALPVILITDIPLRTPAYEKSDSIFEVNGYLLRSGIYTKYDFNYQPQANKINTRWVSVDVPADYYVKGGNKTSYMRDEVYPFFIRWVYNTGEKSASYHIPGREPNGKDTSTVAGADAIDNAGSTTASKRWQVYDTSSIHSKKTSPLPDNDGTIVAEGAMSYWESSESYPDQDPLIWGDLCGKKIRHHKFPDNCTTHINSVDGSKINILGVRFTNITHPLDIDGNPITSIVGYEILRGSREGNKTIIAKGLLNNMGEYDIDPNVTTRKGLYANYPYNDLRIDPFLSKNEVKGGCAHKGYEPMGTFRRDIFTFHSPETQFRDPFLNPYELKIHGEVSGTVEGNFNPVYKHPRNKLVRDFAVITSSLIGAGIGLTSIKGNTTTITDGAKATQTNLTMTGTTAGVITETPLFVPSLLNNYGINPITGQLLPGFNGIRSSTSTVKNQGAVTEDNITLMAAANVYMFTFFFGQGMEQALRIIKAMITYEQYAYQYDSHGLYTNFTCSKTGNIRRKISEAQYVNPYLQEFGTEFRINNIFRNRMIAVKIDEELSDPLVVDNTRNTIGDLAMWDTPTKSFSSTASGYYASLKVKMASQYGQLDNIIQVPISTCVTNTTADAKAKYDSPVYFGGDIYINRYTEKNSFFFFNDWMFDQIDGSQFNYMEHVNIPYPRYWVDTNDYDVSKIVNPIAAVGAGAYGGSTLASWLFPDNSLASTIGGVVGGAAFAALTFDSLKGKVLPNDYMHLDRAGSNCNSKVSFGVNKAYFYLFANGVRDFFVESEINLAHRDWGDMLNERHYDPYQNTDLQTLFRSDIIKAGNYYKYDYSLSVSKYYNNMVSWGNLTPREYNPSISESCYSYYNRRVIYSLPQHKELKKDNWKVFLANNYRDFNRPVTAIKSVNATGAMVLFKGDTPMMFPGIDQLQTENGIKVNIGDGGLFTGNLQSIFNAESVYEQGSCQSRYSVLNAPPGLFWVSQEQGRIFFYKGSIEEISRNGMKWWFAKYLPSNLLKDFPTFELYDNPVAGVGVSVTYDNTNEILYVCKKDYKLRDEYVGKLVYTSGNKFKLNNLPITLGDSVYFEDASFTISYDPKSKSWLSFHDWHPEFVLSSKDHFLTVKDNKIWKHNDRCDLFCNFYGVDYPFEVEYVDYTGQEVSVLKSIEYQLECYRYNTYCRDMNHVLDFNFDRAVIHNTEQISGMLSLTNKPKNDPIALLDYPIINQSSINIICSKEENKYRFNQFWDITRNRGEFSENYEAMWETAANGYERDINSSYVSYQKNALQRKRFRHYMTKVLLKRLVSGETRMFLRLSNNKITKSFR